MSTVVWWGRDVLDNQYVYTLIEEQITRLTNTDLISVRVFTGYAFGTLPLCTHSHTTTRTMCVCVCVLNPRVGREGMLHLDDECGALTKATQEPAIHCNVYLQEPDSCQIPLPSPTLCLLPASDVSWAKTRTAQFSPGGKIDGYQRNC